MGGSRPPSGERLTHRVHSTPTHRLFLPRLIAVTGTNGKTSTVWFAHRLLERVGLRASSFGTFGLQVGQDRMPEPPNLPGPAGVDFLLEQMALGGTDIIVWEAFSSALASGVLDRLSPDAAALTTLSRDHLDVHGSVADYERAKARLFDRILPRDGTAVLPLDRPEGRRFEKLASKRGVRTIRFGRSQANAVRLIDARPEAPGTRIEVELHGSTFAAVVPLIGDAMIDNALAALGLVTSVVDRPITQWESAVGALSAPPGRMEFVGHVGGARVVVDYAHNPAALTSALLTLREQSSGRVHLVFGCGGERDPGKRLEMGRVAERMADRIIVTDDNPRREPPEAIRAAILAGCPSATQIADRRQAIAGALDTVRPGDTLIVAGKGHEETQTVGTEQQPFSDRQIIQRIIREISGPRTHESPAIAMHTTSPPTQASPESSPGVVDLRSTPITNLRQEPARCPQT